MNTWERIIAASVRLGLALDRRARGYVDERIALFVIRIRQPLGPSCIANSATHHYIPQLRTFRTFHDTRTCDRSYHWITRPSCCW